MVNRLSVSSEDVVTAFKMLNILEGVSNPVSGSECKDGSNCIKNVKSRGYKISDKISTEFDMYINSIVDERLPIYFQGNCMYGGSIEGGFLNQFFLFYRSSLSALKDISKIPLICKNKDVLKVIDLVIYIYNVDECIKAIKDMCTILKSTKEDLLLLRESYSIYRSAIDLKDLLTDSSYIDILNVIKGAIDILLIFHYDYLKEDILQENLSIVCVPYRSAVIVKNDINLVKEYIKVYFSVNFDAYSMYITKFKYKKYKKTIDALILDLVRRGCLTYDISEDRGDYLKGIPNGSKEGYTKIMYVTESYYTKRKVLMPSKGVVILVENEDSIVESIYLREVKLDNKNNLIITAKYKDGSEITNKVPLVLNSEKIALIHKKEEIDIDDYIDDFLGISQTDGLHYNVISPYYWKYRNRGYVSKGDKVFKGIVVKREVEVDVAPFLRKAGSCSESAKVFAKKIGLDLPKGYTIVKPHKRVYNKVNKGIG